MRRHALVAGPQIGDLLIRAHEAQVRDRIDEVGGILQHAIGHALGPELKRGLKFLENIDRLGDVDRTVGLRMWRVAELADSGVSGPGIVPAIGGFGGELVGHLVEGDA